MSDPARERVLVVGGGRGTGLLIARLLLQRGYPVRVLARNPARAIPRLSSAVEVVQGDMTRPETLAPAVLETRHIIVTAGVRSGHFARDQAALPLSPRYRIAREDVAEAFVEALAHPRASRTTFDIVWGKGLRREGWSVLMDRLRPD